MRTHFIHRSALLDGSVKVNDEMITDACPTFCLVPGINVLCSEVHAFLRCGAMNDYFGDFSHDLILCRNFSNSASMPNTVQHITRNWAIAQRADESITPLGGMNREAMAMKAATTKAAMAMSSFRFSLFITYLLSRPLYPRVREIRGSCDRCSLSLGECYG